MKFGLYFIMTLLTSIICTLLLHDGLCDHFSDSFVMTLLTSHRGTLLLHDGLSHHFSDILTSFLVTGVSTSVKATQSKTSLSILKNTIHIFGSWCPAVVTYLIMSAVWCRWNYWALGGIIPGLCPWDFGDAWDHIGICP